LLSVLWLAAVLVAAVAPEVFTATDPLRAAPRFKLQPPSGEHPFGTDQLGRDLFSRTVHGTGLSLGSALIAVAVGIVVGSLVGLLAGFVRGPLDSVLMRLMDVLLAIPALLLSLALVTALGFGTVKVAVAVGIASIAACARVMRSEVLRVRESPYVEAARAGGARWSRVLGRHVLPNAAGPVLVLAVMEFGTAVLAVSALSFLGYGAVPPAPEWGSLVSGGRDFLGTAWWLTVMPGLTIVLTVLATGRVARALHGEDRR
jgi:peptide/nickel transport system permease protein